MANLTLQAVVATEAPVETFDPVAGTYVDEILSVAGMELPNQVPLLDSHSRDSVRHVLGSVNNLRKTTEQGVGRVVRGTLNFVESARSVYELYAGGHLSDVSVAARRLEIRRNDDNSRTVTRSRLTEVSTVILGADSNAVIVKKRASDVTGEQLYRLHQTGLLEEFYEDEDLQQEMLVLRRCFPDEPFVDLLFRADAEITKRSHMKKVRGR